MIIEAREDTITLRGAVRSNIWPAIQAAASLLLDNHPTGIIIDCSAITKFSSKGAETFADAFRYIQAQNARIVVAGLSENLMEIAKVVPGVRSQLPIAANVEEARASLKLEEVTPQRGRARQAAVVPILGNWRRGIYLADKLAMGEDCEVHLVDLIKVPLTLPLGAPLPDREAAGQARLKAGTAVVKEMRLNSFSHVQRVRSHAIGLVEFADELKADFSVVSMDRGEMSDPHIEQSEAMSLVETANFEVSLVKGSPKEMARPVKNAVVPAVGSWGHAVEHACKLVYGANATVNLIYLISIPRTEPIEAPRPDAEAAASDATKEAARIGKRYGIRIKVSVERVRDPILGFLKMVESRGYDLAVVGVKRETDGDYHIAHATALALLQEVPCETVFLRVAD